MMLSVLFGHFLLANNYLKILLFSRTRLCLQSTWQQSDLAGKIRTSVPSFTIHWFYAPLEFSYAQMLYSHITMLFKQSRFWLYKLVFIVPICVNHVRCQTCALIAT